MGNNFAGPVGYGGTTDTGVVKLVKRLSNHPSRDWCTRMAFAEALRALMAARGISGRVLSRQVPCNEALISRYINRKQPPSQKMARLIDEALGAGGELAALAKSERLVSHTAKNTPSGVPAADLLALAWVIGRLDQGVSRQAVHGLAATLTDAHEVGMADSAERLARAMAKRTGLTEDTIGYMETRSLGFHRLECVLPGSQLFRAVLKHLNEVISLLEACSQDRLRQRLIVTAGETALLGAWIAWDRGDVARAVSLYRAAEMAARESGDQAIIACAVIYQSLGAVGPRAHAQARQRLADAGQLLRGPNDPATRAWLMAREAEAAAATREPSAKDMIKVASDALAAARPQDERSWTRCLESPQLTHARLIIATRLRDEACLHDSARELLLLAGDPEQKKSGRMLASIALALTATGDVSEGIRFGWRSIEAVRQNRARYALAQLSELGAALNEQDTTGSRELRDEIHATRRELVSPHPSTRDSLPARH